MSNGYTVRESDGGKRSYDCDLCPHSSVDMDGARAHRAVHVAGPELLAALKGLRKETRNPGRENIFLAETCDAAIAKAEPKP